jgi:flagellar basal-body rod modification protein FlgD
MSVSALDVTSATTTTTGSGSKSSSTTLDKNAFLKLLVAQLQHQDPLQPTEGTEFITQLSQFSLVEQAVQQSQQLQLLGTQLTGLSNEGVTSLVGKTVTVKGSGVAFDGVTAVTGGATLSAPAKTLTVTVKDADGNVVRTIDVGPHAAGPFQIKWDGRDDSGNLAAKGTYSFSCSATGADGSAVSVDQQVTGVVNSVSYDKGYPLLTLDSGVTAPISDLVVVAGTPSTASATK